MLRLFVGFFLPESVKGHLQKHVDSSPPFYNFRWVDPAALHVTLKFLGLVEEGGVSALAAAVETIARQKARFSVCLKGGGVFPSPRQPRVFWAGLGGDVPALTEFSENIESALQSAGFPKENRKFKPHVTLAKPKGERSSKEDTERFCKLFEIYQSPMFDIQSINLVQSQLGATGSRYRVLNSFSLGGAS